MAEEKLEALPEFVDVLVETKTRQADWLVGSRAINEAIGEKNMARKIDLAAMQKKGITCLQVVSIFPGQFDHMLIARAAEVEAWKVSAAAVLHRGPGRPPKVAPVESNGVQHPVNVVNMAPFMATRDADSILHALWDVRAAVQANTKALDENTKAANQLREKL